MSYFLRVVGCGHPDQVWRVEDDEAVKLGITNPEFGPGTHFRREPAETIWETMERQSGWPRESFHALALGPREYHPRIARPLGFTKQDILVSPSALREPDVVAIGIGQARALMRRLALICETVMPSSETLSVYGHEIRNLLLLAATEVEAHWRGVLVANGATTERFTTQHYVRLLQPMKLSSYAVAFPAYPWLAPVRPFEGWSAESPTRSLPWYEAYNRTKHDREGAFNYGTLLHAFSAVSACVTMLAAQFTRSIGLGGRSDLSTFFRFVEEPNWDPQEIYCGIGASGRDWTACPHPYLAPHP